MIIKNLHEIEYRMIKLREEMNEAKKENEKELVNEFTETLFTYIQDGETTKRDLVSVLNDFMYKIKNIESYGEK